MTLFIQIIVGVMAFAFLTLVIFSGRMEDKIQEKKDKELLSRYFEGKNYEIIDYDASWRKFTVIDENGNRDILQAHRTNLEDEVDLAVEKHFGTPWFNITNIQNGFSSERYPKGLQYLVDVELQKNQKENIMVFVPQE